MKRIIEWYLGLTPAAPGEGTAWNFHARTPWPIWLPGWMVVLLGFLLAGYVVWIYSRDAKSVSRPGRLTLIALRLAAIAVLLASMSEFTLSIDRTGLPYVAVLIDDSASMGIEDQYQQPRLQKLANAYFAERGPALKEKSRLELAKAIVTRQNGRFLADLVREHKVRVYRFSESAVVIGDRQYIAADKIRELLPMIDALEATGEQTRPGPAVKKVLNDFRGTPPSAVVVISDGVTSTSDADKLTTATEDAIRHVVPVFTIGVGSEQPARDLQLYDLLADEVAFVDDPISFTAKLKTFGMKSPDVNVTLREKSSSEILARGRFRVEGDGVPTTIEIIYTPTTPGEFDYVVEAAALPNETNEKNNAESRHISVRREKIRVLLADSAPRYEFRYLKQMLEREKTIELQTVLQEADLEFAEEDQTALRHFPVKRDDLFQFDVVIFGDINPAYLSAGVFENLREFVREAGGGLMLVAGVEFNPRAYQGTPLEDMFPIELSTVAEPRTEDSIGNSFAPELTLEGRKGTTIFRFAESEEDSLAIWNGLPGMFWLVEAPDLKPGAVVFAQHPARMGTERKLPLIAMQRFGAGKVFFHATDELWRWRFRVGDLYYARYWVQTIRYLSRMRLLGQARSAELSSDRRVYQRGDTAHIRVRFVDERLIPAEGGTVTVMVERQGDIQQPVELSRLTEAPTVFEGRINQISEGSYHAWIAKPSFSEAPPAVDFRVEAPLKELQNHGLDRAELTEIAKRTHGRHYLLPEAHRLAADLPPGRPIPLESEDPILLWSRWELLCLFVGLLAAEWLLRKRLRLI